MLSLSLIFPVKPLKITFQTVKSIYYHYFNCIYYIYNFSILPLFYLSHFPFLSYSSFIHHFLLKLIFSSFFPLFYLILFLISFPFHLIIHFLYNLSTLNYNSIVNMINYKPYHHIHFLFFSLLLYFPLFILLLLCSFLLALPVLSCFLLYLFLFLTYFSSLFPSHLLVSLQS
jgi:hypothetical protein